MRKDKIWLFSLDVLQNTLNNSHSYIELCDKLGLTYSKTQIKMIIYRVKVDNIDRNIFTENCKTNKRKSGNFIPRKLGDILVKDSTYINTNSLKQKLIKLGILENICNNCGVYEWDGRALTCQLDHINGISNDNRLENLRILCPNCHSQTSTYANKKIKDKKDKEKRELILCVNCNKESNGKIFCVECQNKISEKRRKFERPPLIQLLTEIKELGYCGTGRKYGVSDNAIRKWIKNYNKYHNNDN